jgi:hypothetical protein
LMWLLTALLIRQYGHMAAHKACVACLFTWSSAYCTSCLSPPTLLNTFFRSANVVWIGKTF